MITDAFLNVFTEQDFNVDPADGLHRIQHPNMVFEKLGQICTDNGYSYEWTFVDVKMHPKSAKLLVYGTLKVFEVASPANSVTVPGAATGATEMNEVAGVTTSAFLNACLRGLRMAEFIYALEPEPVQAPPPQRQAPAPPPQAQQQAYPPQRQAPPSNGGYQSRPRPGGGGNGGGYRGGGNGGGGGSRSTPVQDRVVGGQGKWAGTRYGDLPIETLQQWASFDEPNKNAVAELNRRQQAGSGAPSGYSSDYGHGDPAEDEIPF